MKKHVRGVMRLAGLLVVALCVSSDLSVAADEIPDENLRTLSEDETVRYLKVSKAVFTDALGKPMPGDIKVTTGGKPVPVASDGSVRALRLARMFEGYVEVSHPAYGRVRFNDLQSLLKPYIVLPLVKDGTVEAGRAVAGQVTDKQNTPVPDAELTTQINGPAQRANYETKVMTDAQGRYRLHPAMAAEEVGKEPGRILTEREGVWMYIKKPEPGWLSSYSYAHGKNYVVELTKAKRDYKVTIKGIPAGTYVSSWGSVKEPNGVEAWNWQEIHQAGQRVLMPEGTYRIAINGKERYPVTVKADSPDELVFEMKPAVRCAGRVVDAATEKPMAGVLVGVMRNSTIGRSVAGVPESDWDKLTGLKNPVDLKNDVPQTIVEAVSLEYCCVTNDAGEFDFEMKTHDTECVVALARGMMPSRRLFYPSSANKEGVIKTRDIEMVPSATLVLDPMIKPEEQEQMKAADVGLAFDLRTPMKWAARHQWEDPTERRTPLLVMFERVEAAKQEVVVPAGVPIEVILTQFKGHDRDDLVPNGPVRWLIGPLTLKAGERWETKLIRTDLTRANFRVVLSDGQPLANVKLGLGIAEDPALWTTSEATTEDGVAMVYCPAGKKVKIGLGNPSPIMKYPVWVEMDVPEKPGDKPITIQVTNKMLNAFLWPGRITALKEGPRGKALKLDEEGEESKN